jgi:hypothetical protein
MSIQEGEPEEFQRRPVMHSGAVTAVAIVNYVLAGIVFLFGLLFMFLGAQLAAWIGMAGDAAQAQGADAAKAAKEAGGLFAALGLFAGICIMIFGVPYLLAGVGVMNRRQWGRILTLVLGALSGLSALYALMNFSSTTIPNILISAGYCVLVYVVLLNKQYAAEFK